MNTWLAAAAVASLATALIHILAGGRHIARPLMEAGDLTTVPKHTQYYCWHIVSIVLLAMAGGYAYGSTAPEAMALNVMLTGLAASFALWNIALILWKRLDPKHMIQWALFLPITLLGLAGLI
ncbi:hypothetical protein [Pelagibius sp. Alg239-R121]|uniref:hypothetical protein n=1 Tax=Pelagibius sp. Alg239-R121 TaxID=2993448 RepID=UPI0024A78E29|nr:hypothetical protein [Pelagibius sp. Alg239-R121]